MSDIAPRQAELDRRIHELTSKWLPMLLSRAGVAKSMSARLREGVESEDELRRQLEIARLATAGVSRQTSAKRAETAQLAESTLAVITTLRDTLDLRTSNLSAAERSAEAVNRRMLGLLVGLPGSRAQVEIERSGWLTRLLSRSATAGTAAY